jgi:hypothetical protein
VVNKNCVKLNKQNVSICEWYTYQYHCTVHKKKKKKKWTLDISYSITQNDKLLGLIIYALFKETICKDFEQKYYNENACEPIEDIRPELHKCLTFF